MQTKRVTTERLILVIVTITLILILFTAWKVNNAVDRVNVAIHKIESLSNPIDKAKNRAAGFIEDKVKKGIRKLKGDD